MTAKSDLLTVIDKQPLDRMPKLAIVLTDNFPILSVTLVTEPLRVANRELAQNLWSWHILSAAGGPIHSSSGLELQAEPLDDVP